jgi:signal peptidase II
MKKSLYLLISLAMIILDQGSKWLVVKFIPLSYPPYIAWHFGQDFLQIIHVRNTGVLFSIGAGWADSYRIALFMILPLIFLFFLAWLVAQDKPSKMTKVLTGSLSLSKWQRVAFAMIVGGGLGNVIDRFFRPLGVVDFIDVKFYNLFGMARWPTFNISDSVVVIAMIMLLFIPAEQKNL